MALTNFVAMSKNALFSTSRLRFVARASAHSEALYLSIVPATLARRRLLLLLGPLMLDMTVTKALIAFAAFP